MLHKAITVLKCFFMALVTSGKIETHSWNIYIYICFFYENESIFIYIDGGVFHQYGEKKERGREVHLKGLLREGWIFIYLAPSPGKYKLVQPSPLNSVRCLCRLSMSLIGNRRVFAIRLKRCLTEEDLA